MSTSADWKTEGKLAALIVGAGLMGRHHARAATAAGARIAAIVDSNPAAAAALAASCPGAAIETDLESALKSASADVAHICTPIATHVRLGEAVAKARLHALIEKPLAISAADAKRVHDAFATAGKLVCPAHQYAFQRSVADAVQGLPRAGAVRRVAFDICSAGAAGGLNADEVIADILPHPLSIVQKLLPSVNVAALDWTCVRAAAGEWVITAPAGEATMVIQISMNGRPTRFLTRVTAETGTFELDNFHDFAVRWPGQVSRAAKIAQPFLRHGKGLAAGGVNLAGRALRRESAYPGLGALVSAFYRAVRDGDAAPVSPEQSLAVAEARDRIVVLAHG